MRMFVDGTTVGVIVLGVAGVLESLLSELVPEPVSTSGGRRSGQEWCGVEVRLPTLGSSLVKENFV